MSVAPDVPGEEPPTAVRSLGRQDRDLRVPVAGQIDGHRVGRRLEPVEGEREAAHRLSPRSQPEETHLRRPGVDEAARLQEIEPAIAIQVGHGPLRKALGLRVRKVAVDREGESIHLGAVRTPGEETIPVPEHDLRLAVAVQIGEQGAPGGPAIEQFRPAARLAAVLVQGVHLRRNRRIGNRRRLEGGELGGAAYQIEREGQGRLGDFGPAVAIQIAGRRRLPVHHLLKPDREPGHHAPRRVQRGEPGSESRFDEDDLRPPVAVEIGRRQVGVDVTLAALRVEGGSERPAGARFAVGVEDPNGSGAGRSRHLRPAVAIEIRHQRGAGRAGGVQIVRRHHQRPARQVGAVGPDGEQVGRPRAPPGADAEHHLARAVAVEIADTGGADRIGGRRQAREAARPPAQRFPSCPDDGHESRRHGGDQLGLPIGVQVGRQHRPFARADVDRPREEAGKSGSVRRQVAQRGRGGRRAARGQPCGEEQESAAKR